MTRQEKLYEAFLRFSKKSDTLPAKYSKFKKIVLDICGILAFKKPNDEQLDIFEKSLNKWENDFIKYQALNKIF